jgi:hypothetical protein
MLMVLRESNPAKAADMMGVTVEALDEARDKDTKQSVF